MLKGNDDDDNDNEYEDDNDYDNDEDNGSQSQYVSIDHWSDTSSPHIHPHCDRVLTTCRLFALISKPNQTFDLKKNIMNEKETKKSLSNSKQSTL